MKKIANLLALTLVLLISCQAAIAQPTPTITKKYTNAEIEKFIDGYNALRSHDTHPSTALQQQLAKDFPNARDIDWEMAANVYEAEFEIGRTDYKAYYDADGNLLAYSIDIRESQVPAIVKNAAASKYPNCKMDDSKKIVQGTEVFYKVEMEKRKFEAKALFSQNGAFIKELHN
ncbi:hypothetical protein M2451_002088 [Dysgonomonas sp. PFB1-18]|uniref:PepSY-like domain-containing protein n=1 Tax=unclassified Dysgonomonas TaxID=2630389 RepID=UPI0024769549|nr:MULTISPECIES: PepSY-like domain-containing protein [unclassified Dysgonomonas]MDH6309728.1 hypothetical protein [Dysgonomonas sp. PF1-14]MDH6339264.1 hypothetical protein [Dysgonomonas sp. PF1-16]MDH6380763.1 hypothetical protein [Dysgonomonas sp. PFB1-18]MDH6398259.1 hypothetical protein [Dysgonomonas sp. PF1-23]